MSELASGRFGMRITQLLDASGRSDRAVYLRDLSDQRRGFKPHEAVLASLEALGARRLPDSLTQFAYDDEGRGSGTIELLGLRADELARIADVFRVSERSAALGLRDPAARWPDRNPLVIAPTPWRNPVLMTAVAAVLGVGFLGIAVAIAWGPLRMTTTGGTVLLAVLAAVPVILCAILVGYHVRRIPWWRRMRASFLEAGEPLPDELRWFR